MKKNLLLALFFVFFFYGCGGGGASSSGVDSSTSVKTAYFYDSAVNGIEYNCGNKITGLTGDSGSDGSFRYQSDCTVQFKIGKINLGSITGNSIIPSKKIYPTTILGLGDSEIDDRVENMLVFLQTLDSDSNTSNGITINSQTRDTLNSSHINNSDFISNFKTTLTDINTTINTLNSINSTNHILVTKNEALLHFQETLKNTANITVNLSNPKPYLVDKAGKETTLTRIKTAHTISKDIIIKGKANTKIFLAFNSTGSTSGLSFVDTNKTIGSDRNGYLTLDFNDDTITHFHYFIKLVDSDNVSSEILHLDVIKDVIPPHVEASNIIEDVLEEQLLFKNIQATDAGRIKEYRIISPTEDSRSTNDSMFTIDSNGTITFVSEPNFDTNINAIFQVVTRAIDYIGNMTDLLLQVKLKNVLDNPPTLTNTLFITSFEEAKANGEIVFELNTTLEQNLTIAPDNDPTLSPVYYYLHNYTTLFDINTTTGRITIKDNSSSLFDYEQLPNTIDLNVSVENNNTHIANPINKTFATLRINILNKIDTAPKLISPSTLSIPEKSSNYSSNYQIGGILKDEGNSDKNLTMTFSITSGNSANNFSIDSATGTLFVNSSNSLDYETTQEYNLMIRATNTWWDGTQHFDEVNQTINITNVRDNSPSIVLKTLDNSIPESTLPNVTIATFDVNGTIYDANVTTSYTIKDTTLKNGTYITPSTIPFTINGSGVLSTSRQLLSDYVESLSNTIDTVFTLTIEAFNSWWDGSTGSSNPITFDVNITNVIDNAPVISIAPNTVSFDENASLGTVIYDVNTSGTTYDTNAITSFSIVSGNSENKFKINATTGIIDLNNSLDWETTETYTLGIQASNIDWNGATLSSSTKYLKIDVNNTIESPPSITGPSTLNIHENIDIGEIIASIEINSTEEDKKTVNSFVIVNGNIGDKFELSAKKKDDVTGLEYVELKIKNTLDYEIKSSYTLEINATNEHNSTTHTIDINVTDDIEKDLPLLIIAIEYDDINFTTPLTTVENLIFKEGTVGSKYLKNYFERVSKGKFYFKAATETYDLDTAGIIKVKLDGNHPKDGTTALDNDIKEALIAADGNISFASFDTKKVDGNISADELQILCIVAGGERMYGDDNQSILAKTGSFDTNITLDGVNIAYTNGGGNFAVVGEKQNDHTLTIGLIAKMLSQSALGFKLQGDSYTFSDFDLMGSGYNGYENTDINGTMPVHPSVYNKIRQGWTTPTTLKKGRTYSNVSFTYANSVNAYNSYKIEDRNDSNIYYLLEYRDSSPIGTAGNNYDNGLYKINNATFSGGLRVWKVNNNSGASKILEPVTIANITDNIFRVTNATTDLPSNSAFEFTSVGTINTSNNTYSIGIKTK